MNDLTTYILYIDDDDLYNLTCDVNKITRLCKVNGLYIETEYYKSGHGDLTYWGISENQVNFVKFLINKVYPELKIVIDTTIKDKKPVYL